MVVPDIDSRLGVAADWLWSYLTFERGARLITGDQADMPAPATVAAAQALAA